MGSPAQRWIKVQLSSTETLLYKEDWAKILPNTFFEEDKPTFYAAYGQLINTIQFIRQGAPGLEKNIDDEFDGANGPWYWLMMGGNMTIPRT